MVDVWRSFVAPPALLPHQPAELGGALRGREVEVVEYHPHTNPVATLGGRTDLEAFLGECAAAGGRSRWGGHRQVFLDTGEHPPLAALAADVGARLARKSGRAIAKVVMRVSAMPWSYGMHFDPAAGYLVQLHNSRRVVLSSVPLDEPYTDYRKSVDDVVSGPRDHRVVVLEPGDVLRIPAGMSHAIDAKQELDTERSGVSIAASVIFEDDLDPEAERRFEAHFPLRIREIRGESRMAVRPAVELDIEAGAH